jgi:hypothetical protein
LIDSPLRGTPAEHVGLSIPIRGLLICPITELRLLWHGWMRGGPLVDHDGTYAQAIGKRIPFEGNVRRYLEFQSDGRHDRPPAKRKMKSRRLLNGSRGRWVMLVKYRLDQPLKYIRNYASPAQDCPCLSKTKSARQPDYPLWNKDDILADRFALIRQKTIVRAPRAWDILSLLI